MMKDYRIEMGNVREDFNIYYEEINSESIKRELVAEVDIKHNTMLFGKDKVTLYLDTLQRWASGAREELTLNDYMRVLKRIHSFLKAQGFDITIEYMGP